jgi:single-strand DNA-binding protein
MKNNEWQSDTSFFNVVAWKFQAEDAARVLQKGVRVIVVGRLDQRSWESDDGTKRSAVEVIADEIAVATRSINSFDRRTGAGAKAAASVGATESFDSPDEDPWP